MYFTLFPSCVATVVESTGRSPIFIFSLSFLMQCNVFNRSLSIQPMCTFYFISLHLYCDCFKSFTHNANRRKKRYLGTVRNVGCDVISDTSSIWSTRQNMWTEKFCKIDYKYETPLNNRKIQTYLLTKWKKNHVDKLRLFSKIFL